MRLVLTIAFITSYLLPAQAQNVRVEFCGQQFAFNVQKAGSFIQRLTQQSVIDFYTETLEGKYEDVISALQKYKQQEKPDDWLFYQLIRRTAENISPKKNNYLQYTLYKWYLLTNCGFDAILAISPDKMLFYVQCNENIYNIPTRMYNGKQYICLNYHDYGAIDFLKEEFAVVELPSSPERVFSYKVTSIPDFKATEYLEKDLHFSYYENDYHFKVKMTPQVQSLFTNYPVTDYESYLNIPLSRETYNSLIPQLKRNVKGMHVKNGVDYLMRFTRYAFLFETDTKRFGGEKRLSPEQTLFTDQSDCEDRVALFFCLVKEIYDLPMIVLSFPAHVTVAVQFDKPVGTSITYQGKKYSICEPTPQKQDLLLGQLLPELNKTPYQVAYVYNPKGN